MATLSLKEELETWALALDSYDKEDYDSALVSFNLIAESSRIFFNIGVINATCGQHEEAVKCLRQAYELDPYLAIAYFQAGVSLFLLGAYDDALAEFDIAYTHMRTNLTIDYDQIGLKFRLYSCEILFNRGLCLIYLNQANQGMALMDQARREKQIDEHNVIDEAFAEQAAGFTVFSIPVGVVYRPSESKLRNLKAKDYLGQARLVAATSAQDAFVGFTGSTRAKAAAAAVAAGPSADYLSQRKGSSASDSRFELSATKSISRKEPFDLDISQPKRSAPNNSLARADSVVDKALPSRQNTLASNPRSPHTRQNSLPFAASPRPINGLSRSKTVLPVNLPAAPPTPPDSKDEEEYLNVYDAYDGPAESVIFETPAKFASNTRVPVGQTPSRVADWARKNASMQPSVISMYPQSVSASEGRLPYTTSENLRPPIPTRQSISQTEGSDLGGAINRIRLKLHCGESIRAMSVTPDLPISDLLDLICNKLDKNNVFLRFKDEDGSMVDLIDDSDWSSAIDTAHDGAQGRAEGKLDIWVSNS